MDISSEFFWQYTPTTIWERDSEIRIFGTIGICGSGGPLLPIGSLVSFRVDSLEGEPVEPKTLDLNSSQPGTHGP